ncbi:hypothetical protein KA043_04120 [Candidatus Saccharibacteria bacterium]|nr:hypothetical protein [Candidatus Saccharibacteria bacterium]
MVKKVSRSILVALAMVFLLSSSSLAQTTTSNAAGYRVSPVREEKTIEKGSSIVTKIFVENTTSEPIETKAVVNNFLAEGESGQPKIDLDNKLEISNDFKKLVAPIPNFTLEPKQKKEIPVTISVPSNSSPGGYYGAIRFMPTSVADNDARISLSASVGTIFLIEVPGNLSERLVLEELAVANAGRKGILFINPSDEMSTIVRLKNDGNIHSKPFGKITITKGSKTVEEFEFNALDKGSGNILPNQIRQFEDKLKNDKWFGKYKVTANISYGDGGDVITASKSFWAIPSWLAVLVALGFAAIVFGAIYFFVKRGTSNKKVSAKRR